MVRRKLALLKPPIKEKHSLQAKWRSARGNLKVSLMEKLRAATKVVKDKVAITKANWSRGKANKIRAKNMFPGKAWKASREITARDSCHHNMPTNMKTRIKNRELAANDKQNFELFEEHLLKVHNNKRERFVDTTKFLKLREEFTDLDSPTTMKEFVRAIGKLKNNKAPGITEIPAEVFKCLNGENRKQVYFFIVDF